MIKLFTFYHKFYISLFYCLNIFLICKLANCFRLKLNHNVFKIYFRNPYIDISGYIEYISSDTARNTCMSSDFFFQNPFN